MLLPTFRLPATLLLILLISYSIAEISLDSNCFHRWQYDQGWCWRMFSPRDYCDAVEICRFYGGSLANDRVNFTQNFTLNFTSNYWLHDAVITLFISCSPFGTSLNTTKYTCPLGSPTGVKKLSNCSSVAKFTCNSFQSPVKVGLKSGEIKLQQISSSSSYHSQMEPIRYESNFGRLDGNYAPGTPTQGGWCSQSASAEEYYQVNVDKMVLVTSMKLQGVTGRQCNFWVTHFIISYKVTTEKWIMYEGGPGNQTFLGNKDAQHTREIHFDRPFVAREIRVHPMGGGSNCDISGDRYCLRLEINVVKVKDFSDPKTLLRSRISFPVPNTNKRKALCSLPCDLDHDPDWPTGSYALPRPISGCPFSRKTNWSFGYRLYDGYKPVKTFNSTRTTSNHHLRNSISQFYFVEEFCTKKSRLTEETNTILFPPGKYCIYKVGASCPKGFGSGRLRFYENETQVRRTWSYLKGRVPEHSIMFNTSHPTCCFTEMHYCCRSDSQPQPINLPSSLPFYLIPLTLSCPDVQNTNKTIEVFQFSVDKKLNNIREVAFGSHPYVTVSGSAENTTISYYLCYYEPTISNKAFLELQLKVENQEINANFPSNIEALLLYNGSLIRFGEPSNARLSVIAAANCTIFSTERMVNSVNGVAFYNGSFYPSLQCAGVVKMIVRVHGLMPALRKVGGKLNLTLYSRMNILIVIKNKQIQRLRSLVQDLKQMKEKIAREQRKVAKDVNFELFPYDSINDVMKKMKECKFSSKGNPNQVHGVVGINVQDAQAVLNSFTAVHDILFITGRTGTEAIRVKNKAALVYQLTRASPFYGALSRIKELHINRIVVIRSAEIKIPVSLGSYLLQMSITVSADIVIAEAEVIYGISRKLRQVKANDTNFFFIVNARTAVKLFIAAAKEEISPRYNKTWISGSNNGVYEYGVGSYECYKLEPLSCSEEFKGTWMIKGFQSVSTQGSFIQGGGINNVDFSKVRYNRNPFHIKLLRAMVLEGAEAVANGILALSKDNVTITTPALRSLVQERAPLRLQNYRFGDFTLRFPVNNSYACLSGWNGTNCSHPQCANYPCAAGRGKCVGNRLCECQSGFYGRNCSGVCKDTCLNGICNEGALGDGTCIKCHWMYDGTYCTSPGVLEALLTGSIGSFVVLITISCYLSKFCRPKQGNFQGGDLDESHWIIQWTELKSCHKIHLDEIVEQSQLCEKSQHTSYFEARYRGKNVFVKCFKKRPVKLSLEVRMEIRKVRKFDHINVEKVQAVCLGPPFVAIVTELASMGSLYDALHVENVEIPLEIRYALMEDISRGILYLHEKCSLPHGRLKSTNCLLHKGWQLKITDIGLRSLRKNIEQESLVRPNGKISDDAENEKQDSVLADYYSLLWTAPEYLGAGVVNLDQIGYVNFEADVYSFGILMAEILTRRPPYDELKVMTTQQIIETVAHLKEPMFDLELIRPGSPREGKDLAKKGGKILRPHIRNDDLPAEEPRRSTVKFLIESMWSDDPENRPSFSQIQEILKMIAPLKGDEREKRVFLLEKESEALERFIAQDTRLISREQERINEWLSRALPPHVYNEGQDKNELSAEAVSTLSVAAFQVADFQDVVDTSSPDELICVVDYLIKCFTAMAAKCGVESTEMDVISDLFIIVRISNDTTTDALFRFGMAMLQSSKDLKLEYNTNLNINFSAVIHSDSGVAGFTAGGNDIPRYRIVSKAINTTMKLMSKSGPNSIVITEDCAKLIKDKENKSFIELSKKFADIDKNTGTYWLASI